MKTRNIIIIVCMLVLTSIIATNVLARKTMTTTNSIKQRDIVVNPACPFCDRGDLNLDGYVNFGDINPMSYAVTHCWYLFHLMYPHGCYWAGDFNHDMIVDQRDVNPFVAVLSK